MILRMIKAESFVGVHTSNLEKIINIDRGKGNIILSSSYYDTG